MQAQTTTGHSSTSGCPPPRPPPAPAGLGKSHEELQEAVPIPAREAQPPIVAAACALGGQCSSSPPEPGRTCPLTHLVDPELAHDDVVHSGGDFPPHIVIPTRVELQVDGACGERNDLSSDVPQSPPPALCSSSGPALSLNPPARTGVGFIPPLSAPGREVQFLPGPLPEVLILKAGQKCAAWLIQALWECCPAQGQAEGK